MKSNKNEKTKDEYRYLQFPLCLLQQVPGNPKETIGMMILYGIWYYSQNQVKYAMQDVCRQFVYDYCRNQDALHPELISFMDSIKCSLSLEDNEIFDHEGNFNPDDASIKLEQILNDYPDIKQKATENWQWHRATDFYGMNGLCRDNRIDEVERFKEEHESMHGKQPMPSINTVTLKSFRDNPENIDLFMAYVAIKSLIGKQDFKTTNRKVIVMRMIGAKSNAALDNALKNPALMTIYNKYLQRYWFDKLILELQQENFISSKIGIGRMIYISAKLDYDKLKVVIANYRKQRDFRRNEREAREYILQQQQF